MEIERRLTCPMKYLSTPKEKEDSKEFYNIYQINSIIYYLNKVGTVLPKIQKNSILEFLNRYAPKGVHPYDFARDFDYNFNPADAFLGDIHSNLFKSNNAKLDYSIYIHRPLFGNSDMMAHEIEKQYDGVYILEHCTVFIGDVTIDSDIFNNHPLLLSLLHSTYIYTSKKVKLLYFNFRLIDKIMILLNTFKSNNNSYTTQNIDGIKIIYMNGILFLK
jgi:hypothetical protein